MSVVNQVLSPTLSPCGAEVGVNKPEPLLLSMVDVIVVGVFCVFSVATFVGRWKGIVPFVYLSSDAGIVSSFVAAFDHPELFGGDALLHDFSNFRYYMAFHPLLIHLFNRVVGDYGLAYLCLLPVTTLFQATGFYLLGLMVFRNRYWAFLLSVITLCPVPLPIREYWGIYDDPLPRSLFHAFLPYLIALALYISDNGRSWAWLMVATGIAFYSHPVSVPHWALAFWLGAWLFLPKEWRWWQRLWRMFLLGLIFVLMVSPWALNLIVVHKNAVDTGIQYADVVQIISERVGPELLDVRIAVGKWWAFVKTWPYALYFSWAVLGSALCACFLPMVRKRILLIYIWILGILFVALGLTFIEETLCRMWAVGRFQMDSVRGIKYLVPLMLVLCLFPLSEICKRAAPGSLARTLFMVAGLLITLGWAYQNPPTFFIDSVKAWCRGQMTPPMNHTEQSILEAVEFVRKDTPENSRILALNLPLEIRYAGLRPVVYAYKDGGIFADTNLKALVRWNGIKHEIASINEEFKLNNTSMALEKLRSLAVSLHANYALLNLNIDKSVARDCGWDVLDSNDLFSLLRTQNLSLN